MKKKIISMILLTVMLLGGISIGNITVSATSINDSSVFIKQGDRYSCTLASSVMLLRRRAIIDGLSDWSSITESTLRPIAYNSNDDLQWNFTYRGMSVSHVSLGSVSDKKNTLINLLNQHPEGILIYERSIPHAILITDYQSSTDTFYCADPANNASSGRIKLVSSILGSNQSTIVSGLDDYWYITNKSGGVDPGSVSKPIIISPPNESTTVTPNFCSLQWTAVNGATGYKLSVRNLNTDEILTQNNGSIVLANYPIGNRTSFDISGMNPSTQYRVAIEAVMPDGSTAWSENSPIFTTLNAPNTTYPLNGDQNVPQTGFTLSWQSVPTAQYYHLAVRNITTDTLIVNEDVTTNSKYIPQSLLAPDNNYRIYINAITNESYTYLSSSMTAPYPEFKTTSNVIINYNVNFNSNGGTEVSSIVVSANSLVGQPASPNKEGYTFTKWYKNSNLTDEWNFETDIVKADVVLYAGWVAKTYNITFYNGIDTYTDTALYGEKLTIPSQLTREGYSFSGWYADSELLIPWDFETNTVKGDTTLFAKWTASTYDILFNTSGGNNIAATKAQHNGLIAKPDDPVKSGYLFENWYKDSGFINVWNFKQDTVKQDTMLYAKWVRSQIVFDNIVKDEVNNKITVIVNSNQEETIGEATIYVGLCDKNNKLTNIKQARISNLMDGESQTKIFRFTENDNLFNVKIFAWDANMTPLTVSKQIANSSVIFDSCGGTAVEALNVDNNSIIEAPTEPTMDGKVFGGWYKDSQYSKMWDFATDKVTEDITLYAKWYDANIKVTFNVNGGSAINDISASYNNLIEKPNNPTKEGYIFEDWYKDAAYSEKWNFAIDKVITSVTLYAKWKLQTYNITFDSCGGSSAVSQNVQYAGVVEEPSSPARNGYVFVGWYKEAACINTWNFNTDIVTGPITLYAKWIPAISDGIYTFKNIGADKYLNVENSTDANDIPINTSVSNGLASQKFRIQHKGNGIYRMYPMSSGIGCTKAIDLLGGGNNIGIYDISVDSNNNQNFYINKKNNGDYIITKVNDTNSVMTAEGTSNGSKVSMQSLTGSSLQYWSVTVFPELEERTGAVNLDSGMLNVRSGPYSDAAIKDKVNNGEPVTIFGEMISTYGVNMYYIRCWGSQSGSTVYGYVSADFIAVNTPNSGTTSNLTYAQALAKKKGAGDGEGILTYGIDVSKWNGTVDFNSVKSSGYSFVIIRVGYSGVKDPMFETNYANAKAAGLNVGVYMYSYAMTTVEAQTDATSVKDWISGKTFEYPIYYDMEESSQISLGKTTLTNICLAFLDKIESYGYYGGAYSNLNWLTNYLDKSLIGNSYDLWFARYLTSNTPSIDYSSSYGVWQYSSAGTIPGNSASFDLNVAYKDYPNIIKALGKNGY